MLAWQPMPSQTLGLLVDLQLHARRGQHPPQGQRAAADAAGHRLRRLAGNSHAQHRGAACKTITAQAAPWLAACQADVLLWC